jgi:F0F1-type ATP synthase delta subunit
MKYPVLSYARALASAVTEAGLADQKKIVQNFSDLLRRNGDEAAGGKIVEEAARIVRTKEGLREVVFESARPLTPSQRGSLRGLVKSGDMTLERVNPELVAGVRISVDGEREFDGSLRGKLNKLFGNL